MPDSLTIHLQNRTRSADVYAYITGLALQHDNARVLLKANGRDLYFPASPTGILTPLAEDVAIPLGAPGSTVAARIPQLAGGRIWFSRGGRKLTFLLNPGPALVEPSVLNPSDANAAVDFAFAEFTLDAGQLFANISYVDFVPRLPVALSLRDAAGAVQHVSGMPPDGLARVCDGLRAQAARDGWPWDALVVAGGGNDDDAGGGGGGGGGPLRALAPTHAAAAGVSFDGYFEPLVEEVWAGLTPGRAGGGRTLRVDTQTAAHGVVTGRVEVEAGGGSGRLVLGDEAFGRPTTADVLGCNSGPFATGPSALRNALVPRLAAGFARSAMAREDVLPSDPAGFYAAERTNHYARVVHEVNLDGKGYAFAYDDVQPDGGADQSGKVNAGDPDVFVVTVGGEGAYVGDTMPEMGEGSRDVAREEPVKDGGKEEKKAAQGSRMGRVAKLAQKLMKR